MVLRGLQPSTCPRSMCCLEKVDVTLAYITMDAPVAAGLVRLSAMTRGRLPRSFVVELDAVADARRRRVAMKKVIPGRCTRLRTSVFGIGFR